MKIQLDTIAKTIKIDEDVTMKELVNVCKSLLPNGLWEKFTLQTNTTIIGWQNPIVIQPYAMPQQPWRPWIITCGGQSALNSGTYNVQA